MSVIGGVALRVYEDNVRVRLGNVPIPIYLVVSGKTQGIPIPITIVAAPAEPLIPDTAAIPVFVTVDATAQVMGGSALRVYVVTP